MSSQDQSTPGQLPSGASNEQKSPEKWVSGDEPITGAQASYLKTLSEQAGEPFQADLTKAQASQAIDALRGQVGLKKAE